MTGLDERDRSDETGIVSSTELPLKIAHFEIRKKLGSGGMGDVYLAADQRLHRQLALKLLPREISHDPDTRARFLREAQTAAALNHKNIITIYEIGEFQGRQFIAMELAEGESLKELLTKRSLSLEQIIDISTQICEGLEAAHERDIVHRDVKPANIVVGSRGQVKVLDFGLAKFKSASSLTSTGVRLGTISYMSPEQARGEEVDHRTDLFSLGAMLYEMLTGNTPFRRDNEIGTLLAIINEPQPPLTEKIPPLPRWLVSVVDKALQKEKEKRFQSAGEFATALRNGITGPGTETIIPAAMPQTSRLSGADTGLSVLTTMTRTSVGARKPVAILPFDNLGDASQGYFVDGITDEITTSLAKIKELKVISSSSARQYSLLSHQVSEIGKELGVEYLIVGSIRWDTSQEPSRFRLSCKLLDTKDESFLWAETYDRVLDQVFSLQSELAEKISKALGVALTDSLREDLGTRPTNNLQAYDYYLRGNEFFPRSTAADDIEKAITMYEQATKVDPQFAVAYARLSWAHSTMYWFFHDRTAARLEKAKAAIDQASALASDNPDTDLALGYYYYYGCTDYTKALEHFALARDGQPNSSTLSAATGFIQRRVGRWKDAIRNIRRATELDPRSALLAYELGNTLMLMREYDLALSYFDRALWLAPDWPDAHTRKAITVLLQTGDAKAAAGVFQKAESHCRPAEMVVEWILLDPFVEYCGGLQQAADMLFVDETEMEIYFLNKGRLALRGGRVDEARGLFEAARGLLEKRVRTNPDDARYHSHLGVALAGLGLDDQAAAEGEEAVRLMPFEKDQVFGVTYLETLAFINLMIFRLDRAIELYRSLLAAPSMISTSLLHGGFEFAPLRQHPEYPSLIAQAGR